MAARDKLHSFKWNPSFSWITLFLFDILIENVFTEPKMQKLWKTSKYYLFYSSSKLTDKFINVRSKDPSISYLCNAYLHISLCVLALGCTETMLLQMFSNRKQSNFITKSCINWVLVIVDTQMTHPMKGNGEYYTLQIFRFS